MSAPNSKRLPSGGGRKHVITKEVSQAVPFLGPPMVDTRDLTRVTAVQKVHSGIWQEPSRRSLHLVEDD